MEVLEFNGAVPAIEGKVVTELLCIEMWCDGNLEEQANVIYLKIDECWYRHYFDCGIIFWRCDSVSPNSFSMDELNCFFKVVNLKEKLSLGSLELASLSFHSIEGGSKSVFTFSDDRSITFSNQNDVTSYMA
ncbi:hypothetical protein [Enterovibrio norvegicus]|uniref:Uncharacterized protein n=1 Tax=Enterovibrio norvegicus TaxID=188144 RepID=A0A2N7L4Z5_9GAMM|nr:hypothetical protein [Enterovibrio norvegicus]PML76081.1 hypothetical protein BCT69_05385 [Enterovibrio norvegicus]PMN88573.1 hypothetical protein BCT23_24000 [Enterovibrio norvegicus]